MCSLTSLLPLCLIFDRSDMLRDADEKIEAVRFLLEEQIEKTELIERARASAVQDMRKVTVGPVFFVPIGAIRSRLACDS